MTDHERLIALLAAMGADRSVPVRYVTLDGKPPSKARPRVGAGGRVYSDAELVAAEVRTGLLLRQGVGQLEDNLAVACLFYRPTRHRIDCDNMIKHVCDAGTRGGVWKDDSQITAIAGVIEYDPDRPRTVLAIGRHISTLSRATTAADGQCEVCSAVIPRRGRVTGYAPRTCSRGCTARLKGHADLSELIPCRHCCRPFKRHTRTSLHCSRECQVATLVGRRKAAARPFSTCADCGQELTHHRGGRCRECWRKSPRRGVSSGAAR